MPVWELQPVDVSEPNWQASTYAGRIVIRAADEDRARWIAKLAFSIAVRRDAGDRTLFTPWGHRDLVSARQLWDTRYPQSGDEAILDPVEYDHEWRV